MGWQANVANSAEQPKTNETAKLRTSLANLNLNNPESDIKKNIGSGDLRFICVCDYACYSPGVEQKDYLLTKKYGAKCLEGTSDVIEGKEHGELISKARKYAKKYNNLLLKRLKAKSTVP